jgi:hypothetical protein
MYGGRVQEARPSLSAVGVLEVWLGKVHGMMGKWIECADQEPTKHGVT